MLRSFENLKFIKSHADSLEIQMRTQRKVIEMTFDFQAFQFKEGNVRTDRASLILMNIERSAIKV
jgi:hypothetical protein